MEMTIRAKWWTRIAREELRIGDYWAAIDTTGPDEHRWVATAPDPGVHREIGTGTAPSREEARAAAEACIRQHHAAHS